MEYSRVGICGFGAVGAGLAEVCARAGYITTVFAKSDAHVARGLTLLKSSTTRAKERGKLSADEERTLRQRVFVTTRFEDFNLCQIIIEAVTEDLKVKQKVFEDFDAVCPKNVVLASTTSSLRISELASVTKDPSRVVGLHVFNPVPVMKLVEIARTDAATDSVINGVAAFVESLGKTPVVVKDQPGFIVNRLLFPYLLDAARLAAEGIATPKEIDLAMEQGCNTPIGPFKLMRLIGLETVEAITGNLAHAYGGSRFRIQGDLSALVNDPDK